MLIYDFANDSFTKLALDWEELARFAKPALLGGGAGLAIGALLDLLFPGQRSKTLLGGLLGAAGGGLYSLLNYSKPTEPADELKGLKELEEFSQLAWLTRQPPASSGISSLKDVIGHGDETELYMKTYEAIQDGDLKLLRSALRSNKTVNELNVFYTALDDAMFARTVKVLSHLTLSDPADRNKINDRLNTYLASRIAYQATPNKSSKDAQRMLADAQTARAAITSALSANNQQLEMILRSPTTYGWMLPHALFGIQP